MNILLFLKKEIINVREKRTFYISLLILRKRQKIEFDIIKKMELYFIQNKFEYHSIPKKLKKYFINVFPNLSKIQEPIILSMEDVLILLRIESTTDEKIQTLGDINHILKNRENILNAINDENIKYLNKNKDKLENKIKEEIISFENLNSDNIIDEVKEYVKKVQLNGITISENIERPKYNDINSYIKLHEYIYSREYIFKAYTSMIINKEDITNRKEFIKNIRETITLFLEKGYDMMPFLKALSILLIKNKNEDMAFTLKAVTANIYDIDFAMYTKNLVIDELIYDCIKEPIKLKSNQKIKFDFKKLKNISTLIKYKIKIFPKFQFLSLVNYEPKINHLNIIRLKKEMLNYGFSVIDSIDKELIVFILIIYKYLILNYEDFVLAVNMGIIIMDLEDYKYLNMYLNRFDESYISYYDLNTIKSLELLSKDTSGLKSTVKYQLNNLFTDNLVATSFTILGLLIGLLGLIQILQGSNIIN